VTSNCLTYTIPNIKLSIFYILATPFDYDMFIYNDLHLYNKVIICVEDQHRDDIDNIFIIRSYVYKCFLYIIMTYIPNISLGLVFMYLISPC
jgi:hypothetical protein